MPGDGLVNASRFPWGPGSPLFRIGAFFAFLFLIGLGCSSDESGSGGGQGGPGTDEGDSHGLLLHDSEAGLGGDVYPFGWKPFDAVDPDIFDRGSVVDVLTVEVTDDGGKTDDVGVATDVPVTPPADLSTDGGNTSPDDSVVAETADGFTDSENLDTKVLPTGCGNAVLEAGEDCEPGLFVGANIHCCGSDCLFMPVGSPCGAGINEPSCDPDLCDGQGSCVDSPPKPDGTLCSAFKGGDTCCGGQCTQGSPFAGECDSCVLPPIPKLSVFITESQSVNPGHISDERWMYMANMLGHVTTLGSVADLDKKETLIGVDILIIASPYLELAPTGYAHVLNYVKNGGAVYVSSEFKCNYPGNLLFRDIVVDSGGSFEWEYSLSGNLALTEVLGCLATYPESAPQLTYFWHGCSVVDWSPDTEPFVWAPPYHNLGFTYCAKSGPEPGLVMTTSDKDWIQKADSAIYAYPLMRNILARLAFPELCK